jgi:ribosomal protein S27E
MMFLESNAKCPYCGHEQRLVAAIGIVSETRGQQIVLCDPEKGGCDNWYAVFWNASINVTSYAIGTEADRLPQCSHSY